MKDYDAIVLGAGPAGSSAAFFLAQAGLRVAIVEKSPFPRRKVCGEFVSATTFPILDAMGVGAALRAAGGPPTSRAGAFFGSRIATAPMPKVEGAEGRGRTLARAVLDPTLLEAAQGEGVEAFQPWKALTMERKGERHVVTIGVGDRAETLRARFVVAAHGSWEAGDLPTQPPRDHRPSDMLAFKGFFLDATFDHDLMILASFPGGYGGMVHRDRDVVGLSFCVRRDALARARARHPAPTAWTSLLESVCETNRGVAEAVAGARLEAPAKAAGPLRPGVRTLAADGVFRVGNAAGEAHPTIAEGISMAIQSGRLLADYLPFDDEKGYAAAWRAQFGGRIRTADALARICMGPAADIVAPALEAYPALVTAAAALTGKTKALRVDGSRSGTIRRIWS